MSTNSDTIKRFRRYLRLERSYSENTLDAYMRDIDKLRVFISKRDDSDRSLLNVTLEDLQEFLASLFDLGISPRSQARIISGLRTYYKFLMLDGFTENDPTELLESPKQGEHLPEVLQQHS